ncbi:MAG: hypothetical protein AB8H47_25130 [Bacteroidia bacterium]
MPIKAYQKEIYKKSKLRANWELSKNLNIGDVGYMDKGAFTLQTTLKDLNIDFDVRKGIKQEKLDLSSASGVNVNPRFNATADAKVVDLNGEVIFDIAFSKAKSYIFKASGVRTDIISNIQEVGKEVVKRHGNDDWDKDLVIITEIMTADAVTILIAGESGIKTEISATGNANIAELDLAKADVGFSASSNKKLSLEVLGKAGTNPLFKIMGLEKPFFKKPRIMPRGMEVDPNKSATLQFVEKGEIMADE